MVLASCAQLAPGTAWTGTESAFETRTPRTFESPDGALRGVVTATSRADGTPLSAFALLQSERGFVEWRQLQRAEAPVDAVAVDADTLHLVYRDDAALSLLTVGPAGSALAETTLDPLLPVAAHAHASAPFRAMPTAHGTCLAVPLECGSLALVHFDRSAPVQPYGLCDLLRPERFDCTADDWLARAREAERAGDVDAARRAHELAVETDPLDPRAYREWSLFLDRQHELDRRIACLALALDRLHERDDRPTRWRVGTPEVRLVLDYVDARAERGGAREAHAALDVALDLYPGLGEAVLRRATLLLDEERDTDAVELFETSLAAVEPGSGLETAHADVGRFLLRERRPALALRFLEDAYALGDRSELLVRTLSRTSAELGDHDRAVLWLERLAAMWAKTLAEESNPRRRERGAERLAALEDELTTLRATCASVDETEEE
ncbi:MAG: hypothetical protein AAFU73_17320 [Planctomycetota bacterium]